MNEGSRDGGCPDVALAGLLGATNEFLEATSATAVAEAHGWSMALTEGERGGARFEFRT